MKINNLVLTKKNTSKAQQAFQLKQYRISKGIY